MCNVVIIEDDKASAERLAKALKSYKDFDVKAIIPNLKKAGKILGTYRPELLFLDVELPDGKGFNLINNLRQYITWDMKTIFYTAHDKYMLDAIRSEAFDYLLKPFDKNELDSILKKFLKKKKEAQASQMVHGTTQPASTANGLQEQRFIIQLVSGDIRMVKLSEIGLFRYNNTRRSWEVLLSNQEWTVLRSNMTSEQIEKYSNLFIRVHQSYIINISYLAMIHGNTCLMYPPFNLENIPISNRYKKALDQKFNVL